MFATNLIEAFQTEIRFRSEFNFMGYERRINKMLDKIEKIELFFAECSQVFQSI